MDYHNTLIIDSDLDLRTQAPNGNYHLYILEQTPAGITKQTSKDTISIQEGLIDKTSLIAAISHLTDNDPHHCFLEKVIWDQQNGFRVTLGS